VPAHRRVYVGGWANWGTTSIPVVRTDPPGIEEGIGLKVPSFKPVATVIRGVLSLPRDMTGLSDSTGRVPRSLLLDISGRKVMDLKPGANDVRALAPGVYFVRQAQAQAQAQAVRKIVLTE